MNEASNGAQRKCLCALYLCWSLSRVKNESRVNSLSRQRLLIDGPVHGIVPRVVDDNATNLSVAVFNGLHFCQKKELKFR